MTRPNQKDDEREILRRYLSISGLSGNILDEKEPPDFIVELQSRRIGVEVTEYHRGKWREQEANWDRFRDFIDERRECDPEVESCFCKLHVIFDLKNRKFPGSRRDYEKILKEVINLVKLNSERFSTNDHRIADPSMFGEVLRKYCNAIVVRKVSCYLSWDSYQFTFARIGINDDELREKITKKIDKIEKELESLQNHEKLDDLWLIIYSASNRASTAMASLRGVNFCDFVKTTSSLDKSPFDQVSVVSWDGMWEWKKRVGWEFIPAENAENS